VTGSLEYAHARMSARLGARPDDLAWRRIEPVRDLAPMLEAARATALRQWLAGIGPTTPVHAIEALLRRRWREAVAEVASWMPEDWQPSIAWCARLPLLPAIAHLARGGAPLPWMRDEPGLRDPAPGLDPDHVADAWLEGWRERRPVRGGGDPALLDAIVRAIEGHVAAMREPALADGTPALRALEARLMQLFRRATLDPTAAFAFLALEALDLARLRGEIVRRAAFPGAALTHPRVAA